MIRSTIKAGQMKASRWRRLSLTRNEERRYPSAAYNNQASRLLESGRVGDIVCRVAERIGHDGK